MNGYIIINELRNKVYIWRTSQQIRWGQSARTGCSQTDTQTMIGCSARSLSELGSDAINCWSPDSRCNQLGWHALLGSELNNHLSPPPPPFLYSVNLTEYVAMNPRVCVCLCVCVCVCVCVSHLYSPNGWTNFDETFHRLPAKYLLNTFFSDFEHSNLMTSWRLL